jgi:hypothetical protein
MITREAVRLFRNSNAFIMNINRQYDSSSPRTAPRSATTLRIRLPNDYVVTDGPALSAQDTVEQSTTLTLATISATSTCRSARSTLNIQDYEEHLPGPHEQPRRQRRRRSDEPGPKAASATSSPTPPAPARSSLPTSEQVLNAGRGSRLQLRPTMNRKIAPTCSPCPA